MATKKKQPAHATTLSPRALNRATLARQSLLARAKTAPATMIAQLAGMQAQWPGQPYIGLWTRIEGFERSALEKLYAKHTVVRASMMRGTLHTLTADDFVAFRAAMQPVMSAGMQTILKKRGDNFDVDALVRDTTAFLRKGPQTFEAIRTHLAKKHPDMEARAMGYAVRMTLPLVQTPGEGKWGFATDPPFALASEWIGREIAREGDLHELVRRYLAAFGPATPRDMQVWSGLRGTKTLFDALGDDLVRLYDADGNVLFDLADAPRPGDDVDAPVRFLPEFDNLLLAHFDRSRIVDPAHKDRVYLPALRVASTFTVDGFVRGAWKITRAKSAATITLTSFEKLSPRDRKAVAEEADRTARFVEPDATTVNVAFA